MPAETGQPSQPENYSDPVMHDALNWLNVVGRYEHGLPKADTPYNRANDQVFRYLGERMAEGDFGTAELLATFERKALQATSPMEWKSDAETQDDVRVVTFYEFARVMNRYAGRVYKA